MATKMTGKNNIKLDEISKGTPFKVPENYFENFSARMADKIGQAEAAKAPRASHVWLRPKMAFSMAFAGIAIILVVGALLFNLKTKPMSSSEMMEAYKYSAIQDVTDEQLAQMLNKNNESQVSDSLKQVNEKQEIIEYLSKENIDINTIIDAQ
jgi:hypothetical protein